MDPTRVRQSVEKVWCELLEVDEVDDRRDFIAAGGDSLLVVELVIQLDELFPEARFVDIDDFDWRTIQGTVDQIVQRSSR